MKGRETQPHVTIHDIFPQSEGHVHDTVFRLFIPDGIVVDGTGHTRDAGIKELSVLRADDLLQHDRHFLLIDEILRGSHIGFAVFVEHRRIDCFDGIAEQANHLIFIVHVGNHVGGVDPGEWLVL